MANCIDAKEKELCTPRKVNVSSESNSPCAWTQGLENSSSFWDPGPIVTWRELMRHDAVTSSSIRPCGFTANALKSGLSSLKSQPAAIFQNLGYIDRAADEMAIANVTVASA